MRDLARLAIAAFGRRGEGSGVLGVDVQRIRRALGLRSEPGGPVQEGEPEQLPLTRDQIRRFEAHLRRELERAQIERTQSLPPSRPLTELDRALPTGPLQDLAAVHRVVAQLKRRLATQGHEQRGRKRHAHVDVRRTMRASLQTGGVPVVLKYRPRRPRRPELYVLCDVSTSVTSASVFFLSVLHALHDAFRKMRSFVFVERISEVTDVFERERSFRAASEAISKDAGVADVSGYTDYGRVWSEFLIAGRGRPAPARHRDRARRRPHQRPRPARRRLREDRRSRGPHLLAQPGAAPVLELRRLGHRHVRALLRGPRVLDDAPARGLRQGPHPPHLGLSSLTRSACGSARSIPAGSTLAIRWIDSIRPLRPLLDTLITHRPGVLPVEACGSPDSGIDAAQGDVDRSPRGEASIRSGAGSVDERADERDLVRQLVRPGVDHDHAVAHPVGDPQVASEPRQRGSVRIGVLVLVVAEHELRGRRVRRRRPRSFQNFHSGNA